MTGVREPGAAFLVAEGILYILLMLDKLHEARPIGRAFDAGTEGRFRALLAPRLQGSAWLGIEEVWLPALDRLRLSWRDGRLVCTDLRLLAAADLPSLELTVLDHVSDTSAEEPARTLVEAHLARSALVLVLLPAARAGERWLPALRTFLVHGGTGAYFLSRDDGRHRHLARLQEVVPPLVRRILPDDVLLRWSPES